MLEMYIGSLLIERIPVNFDHCETLEDREKLVSNMANKLHEKHIWKVAGAHENAVFYLVHVQSKMNSEEKETMPKILIG